MPPADPNPHRLITVTIPLSLARRLVPWAYAGVKRECSSYNRTKFTKADIGEFEHEVERAAAEHSISRNVQA